MKGRTRRAYLTAISTSSLFVAGCLGDGWRVGETEDDESHLPEYRSAATSVEYEALVVAYPPEVDNLDTLDVIETTTTDWRGRDQLAGTVISSESEVAELQESLLEEESALLESANMDEDSLLLISSTWGQVMDLAVAYVGVTESDDSYVELDYELEGGDDPSRFRVLIHVPGTRLTNTLTVGQRFAVAEWIQNDLGAREYTVRSNKESTWRDYTHGYK